MERDVIGIFLQENPLASETGTTLVIRYDRNHGE